MHLYQWDRLRQYPGRRLVTPGKHPAPYSDSIIEALADLIPKYVPLGYGIHDPFAGEGLKLGALCDKLGRTFTGVDLEQWPYADPRVRQGDSTQWTKYPILPYAVVTSPTYNNGCNDHFKPKDDSRRLTYRVALGHELYLNNTGRWSGRSSKKGESKYWELTNEVVKNWPSIALVNVKDSIRKDEVYPLVDMWGNLLLDHGYDIEDCVFVQTPGWRVGSNNKARVKFEAILVGIK